MTRPRGTAKTQETAYYVVYFLESIQHRQSHYIGFTTNLKERIHRHNTGFVRSTKKHAPWKLIYAELYINKLDALGREKFLKSGSGWKFLRKQLTHYLESHENLT